MIIKGVTITWIGYEGHPEKCEVDIPDAALNDIIDARVHKILSEDDDCDYTFPTEPEERSCETCDDFDTCSNATRFTTRDGCMNHRVEPTPQAPEDAMASEWRKGNDAIASGDLSKIITAFFDLNKVAETAIAEEQARTKRVTKILEDHGPDGRNCTNQQFVDIRRRLEEAELKLADAWTDEDMRLAFRVGWNYNDHRRNYAEMQEEFNLWLVSLRKVRKA